jgi:hypothetical protein
VRRPDQRRGARQALMSALYAYTPDIIATATPRDNRDVKPIQGSNEIWRAPKNCDINLRDRKTRPATRRCTLNWTVRNHGQKAAMENDMGHVAGTGTSVERNTAYNGGHAIN